jgi:hypothetical protein
MKREGTCVNDSTTRIQFITDYISSYEAKIRLLNNSGLFDDAKLFELFALEVGSLYLGTKLNNLNVETYTYPCVDLVSDDKQTYVQVSTVKDIPAKIKATLEKAKDSKIPEISAIANIKFIVLNNDSVDNVKDYSGSDQIGNISFSKASDLITTARIIQKATECQDFQLALYDLLVKETDNIRDNSSKLRAAIENSKTIGLRNIECKISNEYEIDRGEFIAKINASSHKNISIQGDAGSGKSALAKKLVESEENILYARAERFLEETDINDIWKLNIEQTFGRLGNKPIVIIIDALEFIADVRRTKLDLLQTLYQVATNYPNVKIITTCRTSDKNAFLKLEGLYSVQPFEVSELSASEQLAIADKYPIIRKMLNLNSYAELLKSPFYIDLIISKLDDIDNISDENELREHIWRNVICMKDNAIARVVESIVFTRAKEFSLGSISTDYDTETINKLISEDVLVESGNAVRLKHDIFEDICFEQHFDKEFDKCKGKYNEFFSHIETFGRCAYRRYQIWTSNKLLAKVNRDKYLNELVFSNTMPNDWQKHTEIGLVKSRHCAPFFKEYAQTIVKDETLNGFIKTTNLYAFEVDPISKKYSSLHLRPSGEGRRCLMHLVAVNKLHKTEVIPQIDLIKLCADYSKSSVDNEQAANDACLILIHAIEKELNEADLKSYYKLEDEIKNLLTPIYQLSKHSKQWIENFWRKLISYYKSDDESKERLARDIIKYTLKFDHTQLAINMPAKLCDLAEMFWTYSPDAKRRYSPYGSYESERDDAAFRYGLSKEAKRFSDDSYNKDVLYNSFFLVLFNNKFWIGLDWTIGFINRAVSAYAEKHPNNIISYEVKFVENETTAIYLGTPEMWLVATDNPQVPVLISDLVYCLKEVLHKFLKSSLTLEEKNKFAKTVRKQIFDKSNNIVLLTLVADMGMEFPDLLQGFSLDLAASINIVLTDLHRYVSLQRDPMKEMLERQIMMAVNMPSTLLPDRYGMRSAKLHNLRDYVAESQLYGDDGTKSRCHQILDYLYSITPNDEQNAKKYLQIQNMDMRTATSTKITDGISLMVSTATGKAQDLVNEGRKLRQPVNTIAHIIQSCNDKLARNEFNLDDCLEAITALTNAMGNRDDLRVHSKELILLICIALNNDELDDDTRKEFCQFWIDGIRSYFSYGSFIFEHNQSTILFEQIKSNVCDDIKGQLNRLLLDLIMFDKHHGITAQIANFAKLYLSSNQQLAQRMFNTIVKLAEDEMNHQNHNAEYVKRNKPDPTLEFAYTPNMQPKLFHIDNLITRNNGQGYQSEKEGIIEEYLFGGAHLDFSDFNMQNYDLETIWHIVDCGLSLNNSQFNEIIKKALIATIDMWKANKLTHNSHKILDAFLLTDVTRFFQRELCKSDAHAAIVFDILFMGIDFSKFTSDATEFYFDIFGFLPAEYFDAHADKARRTKCEGIMRLLEARVSEIKEVGIKKSLYKPLTLSFTGFRGSGDWSELQTGYSYHDKSFLNKQFSTYGAFHFDEMLITIYKLHIDKLLPEVLLSVRDVLQENNGNERIEDICCKIIKCVVKFKDYFAENDNSCVF